MFDPTEGAVALGGVPNVYPAVKLDPVELDPPELRYELDEPVVPGCCDHGEGFEEWTEVDDGGM